MIFSLFSANILQFSRKSSILEALDKKYME